MANLFDTELDIHEQYDLKGSTVNRFVAEKLEFWNPNVAMKDLDFHRRIRIGGLLKSRLLEQIEMDTMVRTDGEVLWGGDRLTDLTFV